MKARITRIFAHAATWIIALVAAVVLAFAPDGFLLMLARAFLVYWVIGFALLAVVALFLKQRWLSLTGLLGASLLLPQLLVPRPVEGSLGEDVLLRVAHLNIFQPNQRHDAVIARALAMDADVISFQEVGPAWADALRKGLSERYPFHRVVPGTDCYGIALFSRLPLEAMEVLDLDGKPAIRAVVSVCGQRLQLIAVHARSPGWPSEFSQRNAQLRMVAGLSNTSGMKTVVIGDLNTVSWDPSLRLLCTRGGLRLQGDPYEVTFPSALGMALIPIDHVLVSRGLGAVVSDSFTIPGSDHRGLVADIHSAS